MRKLIFTFVIISLSSFSFAGTRTEAPVSANTDVNISDLPAEMQNMDIEELMNLTPKKYKEKTGKKLGIKNRIMLNFAKKAFKKKRKKKATDISKGLYILLAFLGLGWLAIGLLSDFDGSDWLIALVLYFLFWLPGFIYSLVKMSDYY